MIMKSYLKHCFFVLAIMLFASCSTTDSGNHNLAESNQKYNTIELAKKAPTGTLVTLTGQFYIAELYSSWDGRPYNEIRLQEGNGYSWMLLDIGNHNFTNGTTITVTGIIKQNDWWDKIVAIYPVLEVTSFYNVTEAEKQQRLAEEAEKQRRQAEAYEEQRLQAEADNRRKQAEAAEKQRILDNAAEKQRALDAVQDKKVLGDTQTITLDHIGSISLPTDFKLAEKDGVIKKDMAVVYTYQSQSRKMAIQIIKIIYNYNGNIANEVYAEASEGELVSLNHFYAVKSKIDGMVKHTIYKYFTIYHSSIFASITLDITGIDKFVDDSFCDAIARSFKLDSEYSGFPIDPNILETYKGQKEYQKQMYKELLQ